MPTTEHAGYRRVIRTKRIMQEHIAAVERVADELGRLGLLELADDLRMSVRELKKL